MRIPRSLLVYKKFSFEMYVGYVGLFLCIYGALLRLGRGLL